VVLINVQIAFGRKLEIKSSVTREHFQHVVKKANASRDLVFAAAFNSE
jgi:hypothetical protein